MFEGDEVSLRTYMYDTQVTVVIPRGRFGEPGGLGMAQTIIFVANHFVPRGRKGQVGEMKAHRFKAWHTYKYLDMKYPGG